MALVKTAEREFFKVAAMFLVCRLCGMDDDWKDPFGALLGEVDCWTEMRLILKEWRRANDDSRRS